MEKSLRPRDAQCLHNAFNSRNIFTTIIEDSSNDGLHGRSHRPGVDRVSLGSIIIDTFCQAYGEALLCKIGVGRFFRHDGVYLACIERYLVGSYRYGWAFRCYYLPRVAWRRRPSLTRTSLMTVWPNRARYLLPSWWILSARCNACRSWSRSMNWKVVMFSTFKIFPSLRRVRWDMIESVK